MSNTYVGVHLDDAYLAVENGAPTICTSQGDLVASVTIGGATVYTSQGAGPGDLSAYLRRVADELDAATVKYLDKQAADDRGGLWLAGMTVKGFNHGVVQS